MKRTLHTKPSAIGSMKDHLFQRKPHFRRVASDDYELHPEDSFDDKSALVMLRSGLAKQLVEADVLLFIKPERVLVTVFLLLLNLIHKDRF